jgi:hypothetical protein
MKYLYVKDNELHAGVPTYYIYEMDSPYVVPTDETYLLFSCNDADLVTLFVMNYNLYTREFEAEQSN